MTELFLLELLKGLGKLFANPLFYMFLAAAFVIGVKRVKRERKEFKVKVHPVVDNLIQSLFPGLLVGLAGSAVFLAAGVALPFGMLAFVGIAYGLLSLTTKTRFLSPAYAVAIAAAAALFIPELNTGYSIINRWSQDIQDTSVISLAVILGVLLVQEGILIIWKGDKRTSPRLFKGKRGQYIGAHEATRLWILPQFLLIPAGNVPEIGWWPLMGLGSAGFAFILFPFAIGYRQLVTHTIPAEAIKVLGRKVLLLGIVITAAAAGAFALDLTLLGIAAVAAGLVGRELITILAAQRDDTKPSLFVRRNHGLIVLGVIPGTPADSMGLKTGEVIMKVNGVTMTPDSNFYQAVQKNAAFCKLEVLDEQGEIRFAQRSVYETDPHELGVLFVHDVKEKSSAVS
ncbi:PDZ domain-containing protein [Fictibacillus aquaticus]|uniref:PDZ domain-containing protein n=1 Tax=Fictibacillus aquaticus TaxID=2021314 RepID=UPI0035E8124D